TERSAREAARRRKAGGGVWIGTAGREYRRVGEGATEGEVHLPGRLREFQGRVRYGPVPRPASGLRSSRTRRGRGMDGRYSDAAGPEYSADVQARLRRSIGHPYSDAAGPEYSADVRRSAAG